MCESERVRSALNRIRTHKTWAVKQTQNSYKAKGLEMYIHSQLNNEYAISPFYHWHNNLPGSN